MGVPAFFKWLARRYGKLLTQAEIEKAKEVDGETVPVDTSQPNPNGFEVDNLYLDMNGIIHPCAHPEDMPAPETEDDMMIAIMEYIEFVFSIVRPRKVLYMAIDGVAPRAKMNQQRARRFKSALEAEENETIEEELRATFNARGFNIPSKEEKKKKFDSNCITPGTPFMAKVAQSLRFFVANKLSTDPGWKGIKVFLTDSNVPGEGEHKIMDFIRHQRAAPGYNPNTKHVVYGLDADLIMLGLATHEAHFMILRESVDKPRNTCYRCGEPGHVAQYCTGQKKEKSKAEAFGGAGPMSKPFQFLHTAILREYLDLEFSPSHRGPRTPFPYSIERVVDDFVFMCFFVGNDFLPHLPTLSIHEGAITMMLDIYKRILPRLGGYITEDGEVDLTRAGVFVSELALLEDGILQKRRRRTLEKAARAKADERWRQRRREQEKIRSSGRASSAAKRLAEQAAMSDPSIATVPITSARKRPTNAEAAKLLRKELFGDEEEEEEDDDDKKSKKPQIKVENAGDSKTSKKRKRDSTNDEEDEENRKLSAIGSADDTVPSGAVSTTAVKKEEAETDADKAKEEGETGEDPEEGEVGEENDVKEEPEDMKQDLVPVTDETVVVNHDTKEEEEEEDDDDEDIDSSEDEAIAALLKEDEKEEEEEEKEQEDDIQGPEQFGSKLEAAKEKLRKAQVGENGLPADDVRLGESGWMERYYDKKFGKKMTDEKFFREIRRHYITGLCWVMAYYYQGCASWDWYYPYHYAPFAEQLKDTEEIIEGGGIQFELGRPFKPYEQLLAVLPPRSAPHIPEAYRSLMLSPESPISDFYPLKFAEDMNGKFWRWQSIALLPFINEERLLKAMAEIGTDGLTDDEKHRNEPGVDLIFVNVDVNSVGPIAKDLYTKASKDDEPLGINATQGDGMCGELLPAPSDVPKFGKKIASPVPKMAALEAAANRAIAAIWLNPPVPERYQFRSQLLHGAKTPEPVLSGMDFERGPGYHRHQNSRYHNDHRRGSRSSYRGSGRGRGRSSSRSRGGSYGQNYRGGNPAFSHHNRQRGLPHMAQMPWQRDGPSSHYNDRGGRRGGRGRGGRGRGGRGRGGRGGYGSYGGPPPQRAPPIYHAPPQQLPPQQAPFVPQQAPFVPAAGAPGAFRGGFPAAAAGAGAMPPVQRTYQPVAAGFRQPVAQPMQAYGGFGAQAQQARVATPQVRMNNQTAQQQAFLQQQQQQRQQPQQQQHQQHQQQQRTQPYQQMYAAQRQQPQQPLLQAQMAGAQAYGQRQGFPQQPQQPQQPQMASYGAYGVARTMPVAGRGRGTYGAYGGAAGYNPFGGGYRK